MSVALHEVRVLDLSNTTPGPFGTQILADLGMTVLKVEPPGGDSERHIVPELFRAYNRGKHSVEMDLKGKDRELFAELAAEADVVIEGFRPGVTDRLGVSYEQLLALKPDLIYVSLPGFRSDGPYALEPGHDPEFLARMGALQLNPTMDDGTPTAHSAFLVADYAAGMYAVIGILAALMREPRQAIRIEVPLFAAGLAWLFPKMLLDLEAEAPPGERAAGVGIFRTSDDRYVTVTATEERSWQSLCVALERPDLAQRPDLQTAIGRRHHPECNDILRDVIATRPMREWAARFRELNVPAGAVQTLEEAIVDPVVLDLGILHRDPTMHLDTPLLGYPTVRHVHVPTLDEHGDLVRAKGWAGLAERGSGA